MGENHIREVGEIDILLKIGLIKKRLSCSNCWHYDPDGSCSIKPIVIAEVGYNYWR